MPIIRCRIAVGFALVALLSANRVATGQEWTRFRGPNGQGVSEATTVPTTWAEKDYNWHVKLPGVGHSSPVIWGDRIFLTAAEEDGGRRLVLGLRASDGVLLWRQEYSSTTHTKHVLNSYASPTPALDEDRIYVSWSAPEAYTLIALDHDGTSVWERDLGPYVSQHSAGPSPIVYGDLVILGNDQDGESSLLAFDRKTGETRWSVTRTTEFVSYATPCIYRPDGSDKDQLIFLSGAHGVTSIDPTTGTVLWQIDVFDKRTVSSPVLGDGLIFGSCGSGGGGNYLAAVKPPGSEAGAQPALLFKLEKSAPYCPTSVYRKGRVYCISDQGVATSLNATTGEIVWQKRVGGKFFGSPICVADRLYAISDTGEVVVLGMGNQYELLGRINLGEPSNSTPAVAGGVLYLRTESTLFSVGGGKP